MTEKLIVFAIILLSHISFAQSDFDEDQQLVYSFLYSKELSNAKMIIDSKFLAADNPSKKIIGYVYLADYYSFFEDKEKEKAEALNKAQELAILSKNPIDKAYVNLGLSRYYKNLEKNDLFIKSINESIETLSKYPNENFILTQLYFLRFKYKSENPLEKDVREDCFASNKYALKSKNDLLISFTYSNLGYFYKKQFDETQNKKYLDSSHVNYQNSFKHIELIKSPEARKRCLVAYYLNYGSLLSVKTPESHNEILELCNKILLLCGDDEKFKEIRLSTYNNMGSAYENLGKISLAEEYFQKAYHLSKDDDDIFTINKLVIINNLSRIYEEMKQPEKSLKFEREAQNLMSESNKKQFANNTKALEIFYSTEQKAQQIKQLEKERWLYIAILAFAVLSIIFLIYFFYNRQKSQKQKTALLETEQKYLALQQKQLQKQAMATSLQLDSKNTFINELRKKIREIKDPNLERILKDDQLVNNEFDDIQNILKEIHPNFFDRLQEVAKTKLSNMDMKYAAYIYLNMDNQQIANTLKADPKTVKVTKYRLKQKLDLKKEDDLRFFLQNLIGNS